MMMPRVIALHSRTWVTEGLRLFLHTGAVQELWNEQRNWKILKILDAPSDLHGQGRISMETHGATLHSDWPGKDQRLPTARDQLPKQVHLPLTLHCKCSQTERTHIASSKSQPGIRKAITHCAPTLSTDTLWVTSRSIKTRAFFTRQAKLAQRKSHSLPQHQPPASAGGSPGRPLEIHGEPK